MVDEAYNHNHTDFAIRNHDQTEAEVFFQVVLKPDCRIV